MKKNYHPASTRGSADHGWLQAKHSFSFANYFDSNRMQFGALRVLNDDIIAPGRGFGMHPHDNMEIITIPLEGTLEHKDSMDNVGVIKTNEIQVMSAGTGVYHSEYNHSKESAVNLLQLWVFPNKQGVTPRYDQQAIGNLKKANCLYQIVSPHPDDDGMWIHQEAWFHLGDFDQTTSTSYSLHKEGHGVYVFVISGSAQIAGQELAKRDALGIWETTSFEITANADTQLLLVEVPMNY